MAKDKNGFVHLHVHSEYSLLDGLSKTKKLIEYVKELGMNSLAITDHGAMYGAIEFYKNCQKEEVKPIVGMEAYITNVDRAMRGERSKIKNFHLLLLAKNNEGYKNLMKLTSIAHLEGYYYKPRIDHETLEKYSKGLVATSTCIQGEVPQALLREDYAAAKKAAEWYMNIFGEDYYLELQRHGYKEHIANAETAEIRRVLIEQGDEEARMNEGIIKLSRDLGVPLVATNDAHYIKKEDATAQDALVCIATGKNVSETKRLRFIDVPDFYIKTPAEMEALYTDVPEACTNTAEVAEKCELEILLGTYFFPQIELAKGETAKDKLISETNKGLVEKYGKVTPELQERLDYELKVINDKGYAAYFLIFQDMANWTIKRRIPINIRGSVAGSLVSYVLGITTVDPIRFNLPFERFLNPYRPSAPDIDFDIADDKRGEMIKYLVKKYGKEKVAQICTFGRMLARGGVRDTARVLGYPYEVGDRIAKLIPLGAQGFPMTIERALDESTELRELYGKDSDTKKVIDLAKQIEGNARHVSVHAGGVVISPTELTDFTPLQIDTSDEHKLITQYEMHAVEDVGLVKLDVLGIRNLSILREAVEQVRVGRGKTINLLQIPLDDKKTFEMLARGETMGVFQLSGSGMTRYLVELAPEKIEDIMMMIALYRPGPMKNIDEYIARKQGESEVSYYHPKMEKFLKPSLGVLVYQDDLLYTAIEVAGYDWLEVDKFRKAVGKKIPEEMARQHEIFVKGCVDNSNMTEKEAEGLWDLFEPFQGYGFNKAHSASYGMVAYQTAYMKANYPVEYMTALLTAESGDKDKISSAVAECRRMGIKVMPPDINESDVGFTIVKDKESLEGLAIRFGLGAIKNVGEAAIVAILEARKEGKFVSFADFCIRVDSRKVNKRVLESLIKVGAMEIFGNRAALLSMMDEVRVKAKPLATKGQQDLFSIGQDEEKMETKSETIQKIVSTVSEFDEDELTALERQLLGFSLSAKPLIDQIESLVIHRSHRVEDAFGEGVMVGEMVKIAIVVSEVRIVITKKSGAEMAFVRAEDETGGVDLVVFPKLYGDTKEMWMEGNVILVYGKTDNRDEKQSILVESVETEQMLGEKGGDLKISIPESVSREQLNNLKEVLVMYPGSKEVYVVFEGKAGKELKLPYKIEWNEELSRKISAILGR